MDFTGITPFSSENVSAPDTYFSLGSDCITVCRFIPSQLESGLIRLAQDKTPSGEIVFLFENYFDGNLALLLSNDPENADDAELSGITVMIDREEYVPAVNHGYMLIAGPFDAGCKVILSKAPFEEETEAVEETSIDEASTEEEPVSGNEPVSEDEQASEDETALENETASDDEQASENETASDDGSALCEEQTTEEEHTISEETTAEDESDSSADENILLTDTDTEEILTDEEDTEELLRIDGISAEDLESIENASDIEDNIPPSEETANFTDETTDSSDDNIPVPAPFSHTFEDAEILYSDVKKRYVLKIKDGAGAHAILPGGAEVFARSGEHAFKGYRMRIDEEEYDLVVMKESALSDKAAGCNAYMTLLGSFQGDCCYCIDTSHPEKSGTHGISKGTAFIDNETGYKWGKTSQGCYEFELENGSYNVYAISSAPDGSITSKKDIRKVSGGYLRLYSANEEFTHISITAADPVISEQGSYEVLTPDECVQEAAYLYIPQDPDSEIETPVADDTDAANEKIFKVAEFEHISTHTSDSAGNSNAPVSSYVFDTFEITDETVVSRNPSPEEEMNKYKISEPETSSAISPSKPQISLIIPPSRITDANITVSTYTAQPAEASRKNADHMSNVLKTKKARSAATAAGIAAGAALLGSLIKALTGKKR